MLGYIDRIKEISAELLRSGKVDLVIGYRQGTLPLMNEPCMAKTAEQIDDFVWDGNCGINLANYLPSRKEKIGIVAKGCDSRNIVTHIIENKVDRDRLYIIGVPCKGMVDRHEIARRVPGEIREAAEQEDRIVVRGAGFEEIFDKKDVLQDNCIACRHRNPVLYDELCAQEIEEQSDSDPFESVEKVEALQPEDRRRFFEDLVSTCIRCYACRNACPLCYCPTCFVDESRPQWVGKSIDPTDTMTFHLLRAFHCAGRCTDCGACERACPMGIKVREFTKKLNKDCLDMFDWEAGLTIDARPALDQYKPNDPDSFIK